MLVALLAGCFFTPPPGPDSADTEDTRHTGDDTGVPLMPITLRAATDPCDELDTVAPAQGEEEHLAAARFAVPAGFRLVEARLTLAHRPTDGCGADGAYSALAFTGSGATPPATPTPIASASFAAVVPLGEVRTLSFGPSEPTVIPTGDAVYVAFDFSGQTDPVACLQVCKTSPHAGTAFWSNAAAAPYAWATLESFGIAADYTMELDGLIPE